MSLYWAANTTDPTTAAATTTTTTTTQPTTQLQIATPSTSGLQVVAFGIEFSVALTAGCTVELIDTGTVACTSMNAHVAAGVQPYDSYANGGASVMTLGTGATGYYKSGQTEGTITATRYGKYKIIPIGASEYEWEWSLGREFFVPPSHFLRVRVSTGTAANCLCWVLWQE